MNTVNESAMFMKYRATYKSAFIDLTIHGAAFLSCLALLWFSRHSAWSILTVPLFALMLNRTFIVFHDSCHNSYSPNKLLNYVIAHTTGIFTLTSPNWILDHHTHHQTNGNIENPQHYFFNETVVLTKQKYDKLPKQTQQLYRLYKHPAVFFTVIPTLYFGIMQRFIYIIKKYRHPAKYSQTMLQIVADHTINNIGILCYLFAMYQLGLLHLYALSFCISNSISFMTFHNQHSYNPAYIVGNDVWSQRDSGLRGSAFTQLPFFIKYFYMGIEYHHIHHMNAKIPGYHLQQYHEEVVSKSDLFADVHKVSMTDFIQNLWLTLYDEDSKRYISFNTAAK